MERVIIYGNHQDATIAVNGINIQALKTKYIDLVRSISSNQADEFKPLLDFIDMIVDKHTEMKESNTQLLSHVLFGEEACRIYNEYGAVGLSFAIGENDFSDYHVMQFEGDVFELLSDMDGWNDFVWITEEEYDKLK